MKKILLFLTLAGFMGLRGQSPSPNRVSIYPNPAVSGITIIFLQQVRTEVTITISDILGNKIETRKFSPDEDMHIDLGDLNLRTGLYLVKVETDEQTYIKRLIVKS